MTQSPTSSAPLCPISFEFFPAKTPEGFEKQFQVRAQLAAWKPHYISVTYGAGGSTHQGTWDTVTAALKEGFDVAPHLSCIGANRQALHDLLSAYQELGIRRIVALRGDLPSGYGLGGEFVHARDLVAFIREHFHAQFHIEVAAYPETHPQARTPQDDLQRFAEKISAGADGAITQYFFNADAYFDFVRQAERLGVTAPITPGIMPITNYTQLARFSDSCGAELPRWVRLRLQGYADDTASIKAFGHDVITGLCERLIAGGVPGLHFYTMNQAQAVSNILTALNFPRET